MHTRLHKQDVSSTSTHNHSLQSRPFVDDSEQVAQHVSKSSTPSLQASLQNSSHLHNFGDISIFSRQSESMVQTKLTVGEPNDQYEQEADWVAEQVMSTPDSANQQSVQREVLPEEEEVQTKPLATSITPLIQREALPEEEEEPIQTKASGSDVIQREAMPEEEEEVQTKLSGDAAIQRETMPEEEESLQTKSSTPHLVSPLETRLNTTKGSGSPLPDDIRAFMEPRFGVDFSHVRVHTGSEAVQMNRELNAQAFTHKQDVYFGAGKSPAKDALTAHELTHVVQQGGAVQTKLTEQSQPELHRKCSACQEEEQIDRKEESSQAANPLPVFSDATAVDQVSRWGEEVSVPETGPNPERLARLEDLDLRIKAYTKENLLLSQELNSMSFADPADRTDRETALQDNRSKLIDLLDERVTLLDVEIFALHERIGPNPTSSPDHPETEELGYELMRREQERSQHQQQLRPLKRWQMRREIGAIDAEIARLDSQLASLTPANDPGNLVAMLLQSQRNELEQRKQELAKTLTSTATEYEQWDKRWGAIRYGENEACSTIKEGGCGPTSLAIVLNFLYQEDPESLAASGAFEIVTPQETAKYAETHGRVCGHGTAGDPMVTPVETQWPGFRGHKIKLEETAAQLRSGNLVIFLCKGCTGQKQGGGTKSYGGHYMVLNGVDETGQTYDVLDPGNRESSDIATISFSELKQHATGFWIVERK